MCEDIKAIVCPNCGDTWELNGETPKECLCFRCETAYKPDKVLKIDRWIFNLIKTVKGH